MICQELEELEVLGNCGLSLSTVASLLLHCDKLHRVVDVSAWRGVTREELEELEGHMLQANMDLVLQERPGH